MILLANAKSKCQRSPRSLSLHSTAGERVVSDHISSHKETFFVLDTLFQFTAANINSTLDRTQLIIPITVPLLPFLLFCLDLMPFNLLFSRLSQLAINFEEFLVCNWSLLTCTDESLAKMVFQLFDTEKSGELAIIEIHELLGIICGGNSDITHNLNIELDSLNLSKDEDVTFDQFFSFVKRTPSLLFPAYSTRDKCKKETLGFARWLEIGRRKSIEFGEYSITDILGSMRHKPSCYMEKTFRYCKYW